MCLLLKVVIRYCILVLLCGLANRVVQMYVVLTKLLLIYEKSRHKMYTLIEEMDCSIEIINPGYENHTW